MSKISHPRSWCAPRPLRSLPRVEQLEDRLVLSGPSYNLTPVAVTGQPAPGPDGGNFTFDFETGGLNNRGQVVFTADLDAGQGDEGEGVFLGGKGGLSQILRVGEAAPGGGTFGGFGSFSPDAINNRGDVAVAFGLQDFTLPVGANAGVYRYSSATQQLSAVLVPGVTRVPGSQDTFVGTGFHPDINNRGDIVFTGMIPGTIGPGAAAGLAEGIFEADRHNHITAVAAPGDRAPGGGVFDFAQNAAINDRGDVGFGAHIAASRSSRSGRACRQ